MFAHVNRVRGYLTDMPTGDVKRRNRTPNPERPKIVGRNIVRRLGELGLPEERFRQAVESASDAKITDETLANWLRGDHEPAKKFRGAVAVALQVDSFDLLRRESFGPVSSTAHREEAIADAHDVIAAAKCRSDSEVAEEFQSILLSPDGPYARMALVLLKRALRPTQ